MFCMDCGEKLDAGSKFCRSCGVAISETKSSSEKIDSQSTEVKNNWFQRSDTQSQNFLYLILMMIGIFRPFALMTETKIISGNVVHTSVYPFQEWAGIAMFLMIFWMMYLNYVKKFKPLIFLFALLSTIMIFMIVVAVFFGASIEMGGILFVLAGLVGGYTSYKEK